MLKINKSYLNTIKNIKRSTSSLTGKNHDQFVVNKSEIKERLGILIV